MSRYTVVVDRSVLPTRIRMIDEQSFRLAAWSMGRYGNPPPPTRFNAPKPKESSYRGSTSKRESRSSHAAYENVSSSHAGDHYSSSSSRYSSNDQSYGGSSRITVPSLLSTDYSSLHSQSSSSGGYKYLDPNWMDSIRQPVSRDYGTRNYGQSGRYNGGGGYGKTDSLSASFSSQLLYNSGEQSYQHDLLREKPKDKEEANLMKKIAELQKQLDDFEKPPSSHAQSRVRSRSRSRDRTYSSKTNYSTRGHSGISTSRTRTRESVRQPFREPIRHQPVRERERFDSRRTDSLSNRFEGASRGRGISRDSRSQRPPLSVRERPAFRGERFREDRGSVPRGNAIRNLKRAEPARNIPRRSPRGATSSRASRNTPRKPIRGRGRSTANRKRSPIRERTRDDKDITEPEVDLDDLEEISDAEEETSRRSPSPRTRAVRESLLALSNERLLGEELRQKAQEAVNNMKINEETAEEQEAATSSSESIFAVKREAIKPVVVPDELLLELESLLVD